MSLYATSRWCGLAGVLTLTVATLDGCATSGGGSTLGSRVTAKGDIVSLQWDDKHPLDAQLRGAPWRLQADYVDGSGRHHSETLVTAHAAGARQIDFRLPALLDGAPKGEVCLYFLPTNNTRALPIRTVAASAGHDTAGFTYAEWAASVIAPSSQREAEHALQGLEGQRHAVEAQLQTARAEAQRQPSQDAAGCERIPVKQDVERPADVVDPAERESATKQVCIRRARNSRMEDADRRVDLPLYANQELSKPSSAAAQTTPADYALRLGQAKAFLSDWNQFSPQVGAGYRVPVGEGTDDLPFGVEMTHITREMVKQAASARQQQGLTLTDEQIPAFVEQVLANPPPAARFRLLAGGLDAYDGCVEDVRKQLQSKYEAWQFAKERSPARMQQAHAYDVQQCKVAFSNLAQAQAAVDAANAQRASLQSQIDAQATRAPVGTPTATIVLNTRTCQ